MPRVDKTTHTDKQKRMAKHIEEHYEDQGVSQVEAARRAWAPGNATDHGGKKSGSGRDTKRHPAPSKTGGRRRGAASEARTAEQRSVSAKKGAQTRRQKRATNKKSKIDL